MGLLRRLEGGSGVILPLGGNVGGVRFLWRFETSDVNELVACSNPGSEPVLVPIHAEESGVTSNPRLPLVLRVVRLRDVSQIRKPVVVPVTVYVIDAVCGPRASHIQPHKAMFFIDVPEDIDRPVPLSPVSSDAAGASARCKFHSACETPRFRVVVEKFAEALRCKINLAHAARSFATMVWEVGPRLLAQRGPAHFTAHL